MGVTCAAPAAGVGRVAAAAQRDTRRHVPYATGSAGGHMQFTPLSKNDPCSFLL